ncbi:hypothetical protein [Paraglaciecola marina]|uniref:hypothetical protein n=1 Tax=Paraglaciecola marina TaxID=2500157 RepID=UPI00105F48B8|nr:hypothetical protein [Paraglaciecola marina]
MENTPLTPEQKQYRQLSAFSKKLYEAQQGLDEAQERMAQGNNTASMMRLNQANQVVREVANNMYAEKKELEQAHPELKAEAIAFGKAQQQKREQQQSY